MHAMRPVFFISTFLPPCTPRDTGLPCERGVDRTTQGASMASKRKPSHVDVVDEHERRFLVLSIDPDIRRGTPQHIVQAYMDGDSGPRIRTIDDRRATSTAKVGKGFSRQEQNYNGKIPIGYARFLIERLRYQVAKKRYKRDGWEVDFFEGPLAGLVLAEFETSDPNAEIVLPSWIHAAIDVTDTLSNRMLAKLAYDLSQHGADRPIRDYIVTSPVLKLVITGGPCSGKTKALAELRKRFGNRVAFVPEIATIIIGQVGILPPAHDAVAMLDFQRTVYRVQRRLEDGACRQALRDGKKLVIVDRGTVDSAAYMTRGLDDLAHVAGGPIREEYARYAGVLCLATPSEAIYRKFSGNNSARSETYPQAEAVGERIRQVWKGHKRFIFIENGTGWKKKLDAIVHHVQVFLQEADDKSQPYA